MANYETMTTDELWREYETLTDELTGDVSETRVHEIEARIDEIQDIIDSRDPLAED